MASRTALADLTIKGLRNRLTNVNRKLAAQRSAPDPDLLQEHLDVRAELRRRVRAESNGDLSEEVSRELRSEAKADGVLRRLLMAQQVVDPSVPIFDDIDTEFLPTVDPTKKPKRAPTFSVQEVAKAFFGRSSHWIRWREREGALTLADGSVIGGRTKTGSRYYTLADVERIAHALYQRDHIDQAQLILALTNARNVALMTGILGREE